MLRTIISKQFHGQSYWQASEHTSSENKLKNVKNCDVPPHLKKKRAPNEWKLTWHKHDFNLAKSVWNSGDCCMNACFKWMIKFLDERRVISAQTAWIYWTNRLDIKVVRAKIQLAQDCSVILYTEFRQYNGCLCKKLIVVTAQFMRN